MKKNYVMLAFDLLMQKLNPQIPFFTSEKEVANTIQEIVNEKVILYNKMQAHVFSAKQDEHRRLTVQAYYNSIITLIDRTYYLSTHTPKDHVGNLDVIEYLTICLQELQQFIEVNYAQYLSPEERMPIRDLLNVKTELQHLMLTLPEVLKQGQNSEKIISVIMNAFQLFIQRIDAQETITVKEAGYHLDMIKSMLKPADMIRVLPDCPTLHELAFLWNFNSAESIAYFTSGLQELADQESGPDEKLEFFRFQFKRLLHLPVMPKIIYDNKYPSMKVYFAGWLKNEIDYLQQKMVGVQTLVEERTGAPEKMAPIKVLVDLSAHQIGIILRAADEARILVAKSLSVVFKLIVPYLSTPRKVDPSWTNMRSRTYNPERRELVMAIDALEKLITVIRSWL